MRIRPVIVKIVVPMPPVCGSSKPALFTIVTTFASVWLVASIITSVGVVKRL